MKINKFQDVGSCIKYNIPLYSTTTNKGYRGKKDDEEIIMD